MFFSSKSRETSRSCASRHQRYGGKAFKRFARPRGGPGLFYRDDWVLSGVVRRIAKHREKSLRKVHSESTSVNALWLGFRRAPGRSRAALLRRLAPVRGRTGTPIFARSGPGPGPTIPRERSRCGSPVFPGSPRSSPVSWWCDQSSRRPVLPASGCAIFRDFSSKFRGCDRVRAVYR